MFLLSLPQCLIWAERNGRKRRESRREGIFLEFHWRWTEDSEHAFLKVILGYGVYKRSFQGIRYEMYTIHSGWWVYNIIYPNFVSPSFKPNTNQLLTSKTEDLKVNISTKNFLKDLHFFKRHPKQSLMLENIILNYTVKNLNFNNVLI